MEIFDFDSSSLPSGSTDGDWQKHELIRNGAHVLIEADYRQALEQNTSQPLQRFEQHGGPRARLPGRLESFLKGKNQGTKTGHGGQVVLLADVLRWLNRDGLEDDVVHKIYGSVCEFQASCLPSSLRFGAGWRSFLFRGGPDPDTVSVATKVECVKKYYILAARGYAVETSA